MKTLQRTLGALLLWTEGDAKKKKKTAMSDMSPTGFLLFILYQNLLLPNYAIFSP